MPEHHVLTSDPAQPENPERKTILLVEDQAIIALSRRMMLEKKGFLVLQAFSGEEAIKQTAANPAIDLILMDIDLGAGMDGTLAAEEILHLRNLPIVFLTSHSEEEMVRKVRGITRYGYVLKSSGDFVLLAAIEMAFDLFRAHRESREKQERLQAIFSALPDLVFVIDRQGRYREVIQGSPHLLYRSREELLQGGIQDNFPPDISQRFLQGIGEALDKKRVVQIDYQLQIGKRPVWFQAAISPMQDDRVVWVARDITIQKEAEMQNRRLIQEQELLIQEIHHRVKNNMAVVSSILQLQADIAGSPETKRSLLEASNRIYGMMELYQRLTLSHKPLTLKASDYIKSLIRHVEETFISPGLTSPGNIRFYADIEDITLGGHLLFSLGIVINELVVNAVQHAFPSSAADAVVSVVMRKLGQEKLHLSIRDNGGGLDGASEGFGISIIRKLTEQLKADLSVETATGEGTCYSFTIPLNQPPVETAILLPPEGKTGPPGAEQSPRPGSWQ